MSLKKNKVGIQKHFKESGNLKLLDKIFPGFLLFKIQLKIQIT